MSNRSMDYRIANNVADAQNLERLAFQDMEDGLDALASAYFSYAATRLAAVLHHCDKRTRREVMRHVNRLQAKAKRIYRATTVRPNYQIAA